MLCHTTQCANQKSKEYSPMDLGHRESCHPPNHLKTDGDATAAGEASFRTFPIGIYNNGFIKPEDIEAFDDEWVFVACPESTFKCPHCMNHVYHIGCLVVSVCGVLSTTRDTPRSSIGIFFGRQNKKNLAVELDGDKHTAQTAELKACLEALTRVFVLNTNWQIDPPKNNEMTYPLHTLVIKTDSDYVVKGMTEWLPKWKENGWKKTSGHAIANAELWRIIDALLKQLEYDMKVQFWYVPRDKNQIAFNMAKEVLGET